MNIRLTRHIISIFLLSFAFHFAHSEFDFLTADTDDHATHDYCHLVISTKVENHNIKAHISIAAETGHDNFIAMTAAPLEMTGAPLTMRNDTPLLCFNNPVYILDRTLRI